MDGKKSAAKGKSPISPESQRQRERSIAVQTLNKKLDKVEAEVKKCAQHLEQSKKHKQKKPEKQQPSASKLGRF